jgi:hypothetical protein
MDCHPALHPTIVAFKELVRTIQNNRGVALYVDLHGHSKLKNSFIYGCDLTMQPEKYAKYLATMLSEEEVNQRRIFCRVFPKILCTMSKSSNSNGYFSYRDCAFSIDKSKFGTGRVVSWRDLGVLAAYTVEMSFCGNGDNGEKKILKKGFDPAYQSGGAGNKANKGKTTGKKKKAKKPKRKKSKSFGLGESEDLLNVINENNENEIILDDQNAEDDGADDEEDDQDDLPEEVMMNPPNYIGGTSTKEIPSKLPPTGSSATSEPNKSAKVTAVPLDSSLLNLLDSYKNALHYQKGDFFRMGKHICQAMFHFANLTHADIEYEKDLILQHDRDLKEKQRKEQLEKHLMVKYPADLTALNGTSPDLQEGAATEPIKNNNTNSSAGPSNSRSTKVPQNKNNNPNTTASAAVPTATTTAVGVTNQKKENPAEDIEEVDYYRLAIEKLYGSNSTPKYMIPEISHVSAPSPFSDDDTRKVADKHNNANSENTRLPPTSPSKIVYQNGTHQLQIIGDDNLYENEGNNDFINNDDENSDQDSDDDEMNKIYENNNNEGNYAADNPNNLSTKGNLKDNANLQEVFANYLANTKMDSFQTNMAIRTLTRNGVFQVSAMNSLLSGYSNEFQIEKSTQNVGFRIKCELAIRKLLKLDDSINISLSNSSNLLEDEACSGDESESNPSVDNQPTSKLLRGLGSNGMPLGNVVSALNDAIRKRKHKELLLKKKREKKLAAKLMKQAEMARKIAMENEKLQKSAQRPFSANASPKTSSKRRNSIHSSLPKFAPLYRMAPTDPKISIPVQIRMMHFKDFEKNPVSNNNKTAGKPPSFTPYWSQVNTVFYDDQPAFDPSNAFPPLEPPPEPNPLLQQLPKPKKSSIYLNQRGMQQQQVSQSTEHQYWSSGISSSPPTSDMLWQNNHYPQNNHLFASETAHSTPRVRPNTASATGPNDANILYSSHFNELGSSIHRSGLASASGSRKMAPPPTNYSFKEVSFDLNNQPDANNPSSPSAVPPLSYSRKFTAMNSPESMVQMGILPPSSLNNNQNTLSNSNSNATIGMNTLNTHREFPPFTRPPLQSPLAATTSVEKSPMTTTTGSSGIGGAGSASPRGKTRRSTITI